MKFNVVLCGRVPVCVCDGGLCDLCLRAGVNMYVPDRLRGEDTTAAVGPRWTDRTSCTSRGWNTLSQQSEDTHTH